MYFLPIILKNDVFIFIESFFGYFSITGGYVQKNIMYHSRVGMDVQKMKHLSFTRK
tara:strand:+ start:647 stop:814 length:168 start_codon:yes stop_codon:yes gene_type:complete